VTPRTPRSSQRKRHARRHAGVLITKFCGAADLASIGFYQPYPQPTIAGIDVRRADAVIATHKFIDLN
jgi:hypothetical protein